MWHEIGGCSRAGDFRRSRTLRACIGKQLFSPARHGSPVQTMLETLTRRRALSVILARTARNILFVAPSAYPLGGVATWLDYVVPGLRHRNWKVTLGLVQG